MGNTIYKLYTDSSNWLDERKGRKGPEGQKGRDGGELG